MKNFIFLWMFCVATAMGQDNSLFQEGNRAYNEGDYAAAVNFYDQILANGEESAELYYNLGNAHYRLNNIASSIYNYEKALMFNPNDPDVTTNLEFARDLVIDDIEEVETTGFERIWRNTLSFLDFNEWAWVAIGFSIAFAVLFLLYYFSGRTLYKRLFFTFSMVVLVLAVTSLVFAYEQRSYFTGNEYAIIFSEEAEVRSEPTIRSGEIFYLHEGTKVEVLESYQNWIKFELANGIRGWMENRHLKML